MKRSEDAERRAKLRIRNADSSDLEAVTRIDQQVSGLEKPDFWRETFELFRKPRHPTYFLAAEYDGRTVGFIVGEVRTWEFGSPPCGWVFAIGVSRDHRLLKTGTALLEAICTRFREAGVTKVRTMVARDNREIHAFFRSQGMMAGPYQELEKDLSLHPGN